MTQMTTMQKARGQLLAKHMFYGSLICSTPFVVNNDIPTAQTDMRKVWYNENFINSLTVPVAIFVIVHEIMHIMFKHGLRRGTRNPLVWNWANDYAINIIAFKAGFTLWEHCLHRKCVIDKTPVNYEGLSSEQIYDIIVKKLRAKGTDPEAIRDVRLDDLMDPAISDPTEQAKVERAINQSIARAVASAKIAGQMPAGLDLVIENILHPPQKWYDLLAEFMSRSCQVAESWSKRNRRYSSMIMPSRDGHAFGELVVVGDTSGSMLARNTLERMGSEINGAIQQMNPERTRVIWADDEDCSSQDIFEQGEEVVLKPRGGGGTDMRKPLKFVEQYDPRCVLLITDGYTPWPAEETPFPLIIGCTTNIACPEWAMVVRVSDE